MDSPGHASGPLKARSTVAATPDADARLRRRRALERSIERALRSGDTETALELVAGLRDETDAEAAQLGPVAEVIALDPRRR